MIALLNQLQNYVCKLTIYNIAATATRLCMLVKRLLMITLLEQLQNYVS